MPDFNKYSNYDEKTSFSEIIAGAGAPLLEVEWHELQQIINTKFSRLLKVLGSGVFPLSDTSISLNGSTLTLTNCIILEDTGLTAYVESASVSISNGQKAYFKVENPVKTGNDQLKKYGNTAGDNTTNTMIDSRTPVETSRRKVVVYTLMAGASVPANTATTRYVVVGSVKDGKFVEETSMKVADKKTLDDVAKVLGVGERPKVYGIRIDRSNSNPATRCTYLADAVGMKPAKMNFTTGVFDYGDWGDVWFVKNNFPCMVKANGSVDYKLNPNDYTKKADGKDSDVANTAYAGNAMSAMPCVWIKQFMDGNYKYIYLSEYQVDETYHAYAHQTEDGDIVDYIYMSMFKGALVTGDSTNKLRSLSGLQPMHSKTAENEIAYAKVNGARWFTKTWAQRNLMQCLLTMMACSTNSQAVYGNGNLNYDDSSDNPTHGVLQTGTLNTKGQFWGANDNTHQMKAFHQEAVWADQWDRIAGMVNDNGTIKVKMTAPYPTSNLTTATSFDDYVPVGEQPQGTSGGYISRTVMSEHGDIPVQASGSATTYECDGLWFNNGQLNYALVGGDCSNSSRCGAFSLNLGDTASHAHWAFGASLSCM